MGVLVETCSSASHTVGISSTDAQAIRRGFIGGEDNLSGGDTATGVPIR